MAKNFNRTAVKREGEKIALEHIASEIDREQAQVEEHTARERVKKEEEKRELEEYIQVFEQEERQEAFEREASSLYVGVMGDMVDSCYPEDDDLEDRDHNADILDLDHYWSI